MSTLPQYYKIQALDKVTLFQVSPLTFGADFLPSDVEGGEVEHGHHVHCDDYVDVDLGADGPRAGKTHFEYWKVDGGKKGSL